MPTPLRAEFPADRIPELRAAYKRDPERFHALMDRSAIFRALAGLPVNATTRLALLGELSAATANSESRPAA